MTIAATSSPKTSEQEGFERNLAAFAAGFLNQNGPAGGLLITQMLQIQHARMLAGVQGEGLRPDARAYFQEELDKSAAQLDEMLKHHSAPMPFAPSVAKLSQSERALLLAASQGDLHGVQNALAQGANIDAKNVNLHTALGMSAGRGDEAVFNTLWDAGARVLWEEDANVRPSITLAAEQGNDVAVKLMLRAGVDPNTKSANGISTLTWAKGRKTRALLRKAGAV